MKRLFSLAAGFLALGMALATPASAVTFDPFPEAQYLVTVAGGCSVADYDAVQVVKTLAPTCAMDVVPLRLGIAPNCTILAKLEPEFAPSPSAMHSAAPICPPIRASPPG